MADADVVIDERYCREMGVRTHVPFKDLTARERDIVFHGPAVKKHIVYQNKSQQDLQEIWFYHISMLLTL